MLLEKKTLFKFLYTIGLIFPGLFLVSLLSKERIVYFWDLAGYWKKAISFSESFFKEPFKSFEALYHSVNYDEYNLLPNLLMAPVNKLIGLSFENYVFSIYLIYLIPLSLIISSLCIKVVTIKNEQLKLALPLICLIFTPLIIAMRFGMPDMIGLIIIFIVLKILVNNDFLVSKNYEAALTIGLFLALLLFTRRWYIFWAATYFPTLFIVNAIRSIAQKKRDILFNSVINLAITGTVIMGIVLVFFYPYFEMSVLKDYRDIYSAYRDSVLQQLRNSVYFYGVLTLVLSGVGVVFLFKNNDSSKKLITFLLISTILIFVLFTRINAFAVHHYYLLAPFLAVSCLFGGIAAKSNVKKPVFTSFMVIIVLNYVSVFILPILPRVGLFSSVDAKPRFRSDFSEINRISDDLVEIQNQGDQIYILASSLLFNDEIIKNTKLPDIDAFPAVFPTQHVDKRDQFPNSLFLANYVIVTDPVQLHLREDDQHLIGYLNDQILNGILKNHYETVKDYTIDEGIKAYLKRKLSAPTQDKIQEIKVFFKTKYPEYPDMYQIDECLSQISSLKKGDADGKLGFENGDLIIEPGNERPSEISFSIDSTKYYTISFKAGFRNKEKLIENCNPEHDGEVFLTIYTNGELHDKSHFTHGKDSVYHISLSGTSDIKFQVDKGKNNDQCDWFQLGDFKITQN